MSSIKYIECGCGNPKKTSEFDTNTGECRELCDICGYFSDVVIINKPKQGEIPPANFKTKYVKEYGKTGFIIKAFPINSKNYLISCTAKKDIKKIRAQLDKDPNIKKYAITFKDTNGNYQTQLFKG